MKFLILLIFIVFLLFQCNSISDNVSESNDSLIYNPNKLNRNELYIGFRDSGKRLKEIFNEPTIYNSTDNSEIFRFFFEPSFDYYASFRLEKRELLIFLILKITTGNNNNEDYNKLFYSDSIVLTEKDWIGFQNEIEKADFWHLATSDSTNWGLDGEDWTLEGKKNKYYHSVTRWCPDSVYFPKYKICCEYIMKLANYGEILAKERFKKLNKYAIQFKKNKNKKYIDSIWNYRWYYIYSFGDLEKYNCKQIAKLIVLKKLLLEVINEKKHSVDTSKFNNLCDTIIHYNKLINK